MTSDWLSALPPANQEPSLKILVTNINVNMIDTTKLCGRIVSVMVRMCLLSVNTKAEMPLCWHFRHRGHRKLCQWKVKASSKDTWHYCASGTHMVYEWVPEHINSWRRNASSFCFDVRINPWRSIFFKKWDCRSSLASKSSKLIQSHSFESTFVKFITLFVKCWRYVSFSLANGYYVKYSLLALLSLTGTNTPGEWECFVIDNETHGFIFAWFLNSVTFFKDEWVNWGLFCRLSFSWAMNLVGHLRVPVDKVPSFSSVIRSLRRTVANPPVRRATRHSTRQVGD